MPTSENYWVIKNILMAGSYPLQNTKSNNRIRASVLKQKFDVFINLMQEDEKDHDGDYFKDYKSFINYDATIIRMPIKDMDIPTPFQTMKLIKTIDRFINDNKKIYLHCWGGLGRTGTIVGCYLIEKKLANKSNVFSKINELKANSSLAKFNSPQTEEQKAFIINWSV
jgi:protein-tyrosine phosphatase